REATRAMDVLGELIVRPNLDETDIDGERAVIVEEIRSRLGAPAEHAQILSQQAMFGEGALGREICGDEDGIRSLPADTIRTFWRTTYRPANTLVAGAGGDPSCRGSPRYRPRALGAARPRRVRQRQWPRTGVRRGAGAAGGRSVDPP